jgi:uncharacterized membrane protein YdbT with pleckstrin-like domain
MNLPALVSYAPGETVVAERRQAVLLPAVRSLAPLAEAIGVALLFALYLSLRGGFRSMVGSLTLLIALLVLFHASVVWLRWWMLLFVVTDRRVIRREGLIATTVREAPLEKAQNVSTIEGGIEKLLGLGHVLVETSSMGKPVAFDGVTGAPQLAELIMGQVEALRRQAAREARAAVTARLRRELGMTQPTENA